MNRRSLLAYILAAPVVGVAAALPRPADPVKLAGTAGREISVRVCVDDDGAIRPFIYTDGTLYLDDVVADTVTGLQDKLDWINIERASIGTLVVGTSSLNGPIK